MNIDLQKAGLWKRIAAAILDTILLTILVTGCWWGLSVALDYDGYVQTVEDAKTAYEQQHNVKLNVTQAEYEAMTEQERADYDKALQLANETLAQDDEVMRAYSMAQNLILLMPTVSILIAVLILEFGVPLLFRNGATVGKYVFGLGLVRVDCVRMTALQLFTRTILGKYLEIMIPVYLGVMIFNGTLGYVGLLVIAGIGLLQVILYFATQTHSLLHDLLAGTVVVDVPSQRIFDSSEDRLEYTKRLAAEQAERQEYF